MRGVYQVHHPISAITAAQTLLHITAPATAAVEILRVAVYNATTETNEQLDIAIRRHDTNTASGTTLTATRTEPGSSAPGSVVLGGPVTVSTYVAQSLDRQGFASLAGYMFDPTPEERIYVAPGGQLGVLLVTATVASFDAICQMRWREIG